STKFLQDKQCKQPISRPVKNPVGRLRSPRYRERIASPWSRSEQLQPGVVCRQQTPSCRWCSATGRRTREVQTSVARVAGSICGETAPFPVTPRYSLPTQRNSNRRPASSCHNSLAVDHAIRKTNGEGESRHLPLPRAKWHCSARRTR